MSKNSTETADSSSEPTADTAPATDGDLAAQVDLLTDENRRLRAEYARARQSQYRTTALGLAAIGAVAVLGGIVFPETRDVLVALGATGLFGAVLTYYLAPTQFVAADVGERVYAAGATNFIGIIDELGLRDDRCYVPVETGTPRLYVPRHADYSIPVDRTGPFVVEPESRGLLLEPTGANLHREFERAVTGDVATDPAALSAQLTDALVEQFELVREVETDVDPADGRATIAVTDSAFGPVDRFDHPVPSFLAVGLADGLGRPVDLEVVPGDERADWRITCRWVVEIESSGSGREDDAPT